MGKTSSAVKDKYNARTYSKYTIYLRKDEALNDALQDAKKGGPIGEIIRNALRRYFYGRVTEKEAEKGEDGQN